MRKLFNFSAGPAVLPEAVLTQAAAEMSDWHGTGMSVMEMSHRGKDYMVSRPRPRPICASCWTSRPSTRCSSWPAAPHCSLLPCR